MWNFSSFIFWGKKGSVTRFRPYKFQTTKTKDTMNKKNSKCLSGTKLFALKTNNNMLNLSILAL